MYWYSKPDRSPPSAEKYIKTQYAGMAELADAYGSGPYGGDSVEVQVLLPAPWTPVF